jgi:formyl-CoA transferase
MERLELLEDPRYAGVRERAKHSEELQDEIAGWTRRYTKHELMRILGEAGVPCSAVLDTYDLFTDPHLCAREFFQTVEHPIAGSIKLMRSPLRLSASEIPIVAAPLLGQHTDEVLSGALGLDQEKIAALHEAGIVG